MHRTTPRLGLWLTSGTFGTLLFAGGCVQSNHRLTVGDDIALPAFQPSTPAEPAHDAPSVMSVTRTEWAPVVYEVPVDGVGHRPNYRTHWLTDHSLARSRGEFPTATTAFELGQSGSSGQTEEALLAPFNQIFDALSIPVLLFVEPQTIEMTSPYRRFERAPVGSILPRAQCETCDGPCPETGCPTDPESTQP